MHPPSYQVLSRKIIFSKGPIHLTDSKIKMASGLVTSRQIIEHPGAVVIIPEICRNRFLLVKQFRFAAKKWIWEWPAGGIEPGETRKQAAKRELMEEAGCCPSKLTKLLEYYPTPGVSSEVMTLFFAQKLIPRSAPKDHDEEIEVGTFSFKELETMIRRRKIEDGKTILGFYLLKAMC